VNFTGERVIPGQDDVDLFNEHRARYVFAQRFCAGKRVLDAACGSGYGSALLAENAGRVVGTDLAGEAVQYARAHYGSAKVHFARADCLALPFSDGQFDVVVAFEIIEHLKDAGAFLRELRRALNPSGLLIVSTPNRLYYTEERGEVNPFHEREFSVSEFGELLGEHFAYHAIWVENHVAALLVADPAEQNLALPSRCLIEEAPPGDSIESRARAAHYMVALCSAQALPSAESLLYLPSTGNVLREREQHIASLQRQVEQAQRERDTAVEQLRKQVEQARQERDTAVEQLGKQVEQARQERDAVLEQLRELECVLQERTNWAQSLDQEMVQARSALQKLQQEFEERTAWALRLNRELQFLLASRWYRIGRKVGFTLIPPPDRTGEEDP
jgi:SAM-dependent methyltransferase